MLKSKNYNQVTILTDPIYLLNGLNVHSNLLRLIRDGGEEKGDPDRIEPRSFCLPA